MIRACILLLVCSTFGSPWSIHRAAGAEPANRQELSVPDRKPLSPFCLAYSPDGSSLAVGGAQNGLWSVKETPHKRVRVLAPGEYILAIAFSSDGKTMATFSGVSKNEPVPAAPLNLKLWNWKTGELLHERKAKKEPKEMFRAALSFSPDGMSVAVGCDEVAIVDVKTGQETRRFGQAIGPVCFDRDGASIFAPDREDPSIIKQWNLATGKETRSLARARSARAVGRIVICAQGLLGAIDEKGLVVWSTESGEAKLRVGTFNAMAIAFSADGRLVAVGEHDRPTRLLDVQSGKTALEIPAGAFPTTLCLAFSPDGTRLARADIMAVSAHSTAFFGGVSIFDVAKPPTKD
jgi:WD40 repeat protein